MTQIIISTKAKRRVDARRICFFTFAFAMVATLSFLITGHLKTASSADLGKFNPGNIISDFTMGNYTTMTEAEIHAFLKSKNSCNDTRLYLADWYSNYTYHIENGHFVCMADELFDNGYGGKTTAAHLIWQAAQDYRINPQVLIVLLQKEQGLITDTWPNQRQYKAATGYGCPDTAPCDEKYYGLKNQLDNAAKLFRTVLDGGWTNYPVGWNYVQYNPDAGCGGTWVNIENRATSSLYRYTPYQPNPSSLAAGYGTGDGCGAYGNRNFYLYFEDWFGGIGEGNNIANDINNLYVNKYGGENGILGRKKTTLKKNNGSGIYWVEYENGFIVGTPNKGLHISMGKIRDRWAEQNYEFGPLGFPITDILTNQASGIKWQEFEHGFVVGDENHGYYYSMGKIRDRWAEQNYEFGPLGWPKSDIIEDGNKKYQRYEGGIISGSEHSGYYVSTGEILKKWTEYNYGQGILGYPITGNLTNKASGIKWQEFERGFIVGDEAHGYYISMGKIRDRWAEQNYEFGPLGWPKSDILTMSDGTIYQKYEGGTIFCDTDHNVWVE